MSQDPHQPRPRPVVLCILDGFGHRDEVKDNAIAEARTPVLSRLMAQAPHSLIATSGLAVGLPAGQMGNSEVGHMNIGAGRVVMQDLPRIDAAIADGSFRSHPGTCGLHRQAQGLRRTGHLWASSRPAAFTAHQDHIAALAQAAATKRPYRC